MLREEPLRVEGDDQGAFDPRIRRLADALLREVIRSRAVSLEVEPMRERYRVRVRVDGELRKARTCLTLSHEHGRALVARLKLLGGTVPRPLPVPTTGAIRTGDGRRWIVDTLPAHRGETVCVTVVHTPDVPRTIDALGLEPVDRALLEAALDARRGLVLVGGPADSGKRTLLHAALRHLAASARGGAVLSIDAHPSDDLPGVLQSVPFDEVGFTRATILARAERVGADAVALGDPLKEPRIASALAEHASTRRLGLGVARAQDAAQAAARLVDLGLEPAHLASLVALVISVRLVPRLCPECKAPARSPTPLELARLDARVEPASWTAFEPRGCDACEGVGRRGRLVAAELLPLAGLHARSPFLAQACMREELRARRRQSLRDAALRLARAGLVSFEDALQSTPPA